MGSTAMKSTVNHSTMKAILLALFCLCFPAVSRAEELSGRGNHNNEEINALKLRLATVEKELQSHTTYNEKMKIAFSVTLNNGNRRQLGPFTTAITIVYPKVHTNVGNSFNVHTGIFTATVKGFYFFSYTAYTAHVVNTFVSLMKNNENVASLWDTYSSDLNDSGSNSAILKLEVGDHVYMRLNEGKQLYDDTANYNTFSGFLLFPF